MTPEQFLMWARVLPEPLCLIAGDGQILACNAPATTLFGLSDEALRTKSLLELTADTGEKVKKYLRACSSSREMSLGSLTLRAPNGTLTECRCEGAVLQPRSDTMPSVLLLRFKSKASASNQFLVLNAKITALDKEIRERRRAEQEAQEQRQRLKITLASIGDAVIATDAQGRITFMNPVAQTLTGWREPEALEKPLTEVFHIINEQTRAVVESPVDKVLESGTIVGLANHTLLIAKDGVERPIDDSGAPIRDEQGQVIGVILVFRDVSERKLAEAALHKEQRFINTTVDTLPGIFYLISEQGQFLRWNKNLEEVTHYSAEEISGKHPLDLFGDADKPHIAERIGQVFTEGQATAEAELVAKTGAVIPHFFTGKRIELDQQLCLVGMGIDITDRQQAEREREELLAHAQAARAEAEAAEQRADFLARAGELLSSSLDYEATLKRVAQLVVPQFADWCGVDISAPDGSIQRVAIAHQDPAKIAFAEEVGRRYPPDPREPHGLPNVLRTGQAEIYPEITDELLVQGAKDAEHLELLRAVGLKSVMIVPLVARGLTLGAITFVTGESDHRYGEEDLIFAQDLARRAALAVDNARLYREAEAALHEREQALDLHRNVEERLSLLVEASNKLLGSMQLEEVQQAVLDISGQLISADAYAVWRKEKPGEVWRVVAAIGLSESFQQVVLNARNLNAPPLTQALAVASVNDIPWLEHRQEAYQREGLKSFLAIPLLLQGEYAGTITFYYRYAHQFTEIEIRVATALANLAAAALSTAELYQEQLRLRAKAEETSRLKDEFLATVSHELRTPLNAILGWARLLRIGNLDQSTAARALETIEQNARSQNALIEDILDVSRIITGRLRLNPQTIELVPLLEAALDSVQPTAAAKGVRLLSTFTPEASSILGDPQRIQQIIWNLLSNAIKFTPKGGQVQVSMARRDSSVEITISDTGVGIRPDFLPFVFDRFRQEDSSSTRSFGGLGLGLAIVRHLVELHGGNVFADSSGEGQGATFRIRLPIAMLRQPSPLAPTAVRLAASSEFANLALDLQGLRILGVDDDKAARDLLKVTLTQSGAEVQTAASAAEALAVLDVWQPDILVSDIGMPLEDGYTLIRKIRARGAERNGELLAVALTAYAKSEERLRALSAGYQMHVAKPVDPLELIAVIASLAGRLKK